jgi:Chaperone of endosialidase
MNTISKWTMALLLLSGAAYAQDPAGTWTGNDISDAYFNTGMGTNALYSITPSSRGCSTGSSGGCNTAAGYQALYSNTTGVDNTASGYEALYFNTSGDYNTASGYEALYSNTGLDNTASGYYALYSNTNGHDNTAFGYQVLRENINGYFNVALGSNALLNNTSGSRNIGIGTNALYQNRTGISNTASGLEALFSNTTGSYNIALGYDAGYNLKTGSNNIDIGNEGMVTDGVATNSGIIRIGTQSPTALQTNTYIAGIYDNSSVTGLEVVIDSNGQLGTVSSSERFKTGIEPMGSNTTKLQQLRPVTFRYKADRQGTLRYGLIAEEVAKVYPELVVRDNKGRIDGVRYDELAPMLLNELQKQQKLVAAQAARIAVQDRRAVAQDAKIAQLQEQVTGIQSVMLKWQRNDQVIAQR